MICSRKNPFSEPGFWKPPEQLLGLEKPVHEVLAEFIHRCPSDPTTRTVATTALVLSFWQLQGGAIKTDVPSMLLLNTGDRSDDPIDVFCRGLAYDAEENKPRVQTAGPFMHAPIIRAPVAMRNALRKRQALGRQISPDDYCKQLEAEAAEEKFRAAQITGHGFGRSRRYSKAWHSEYGFMTDQDDQLILRLNDDEDRTAFCREFCDEPWKFISPRGIGADLFPTEKTISISGSLSLKQWTGNLAGNILASGLPIFVLPHAAKSPLRENCRNALQSFAKIWQSEILPPIDAATRLPGSDEVRHYHLALRKRLSALPPPAEFPTLQVVHQLHGICELIASATCGLDASREEAVALCSDLFRQTFRGLVIGIASYSWFGLGLMPGSKALRKSALKLLKHLRNIGPVTKTQLLKNFHLFKRERDPLLEKLVGEGLITVDGPNVMATTYREFVECLYASEEFPPVENHWEKVREGRNAATEATT